MLFGSHIRCLYIEYMYNIYLLYNTLEISSSISLKLCLLNESTTHCLVVDTVKGRNIGLKMGGGYF